MWMDNSVLANEIFYISQNATRIARAFFEIALHRLWAGTALALLDIAKFIEQRSFHSPLRHLIDLGLINNNTLDRIEGRVRFDSLLEMRPDELGPFFVYNLYSF
jgi:antiviral helicase SLH1